MHLRLALAFAALLGTASAAFAQPLPMSVSDRPNDETMELSYRDEFRVRVGTTIPIARTDEIWITLGGAVDIHDPPQTSSLRASGAGLSVSRSKGRLENFRVGAHLFHESDHQSFVQTGDLEYVGRAERQRVSWRAATREWPAAIPGPSSPPGGVLAQGHGGSSPAR